uniref:Uncharacterized protein n=1 Tax=Anopheles atroparvus TaxID=41427 RepID=A0A182JME8_ANOAO
MERDYIGAQRRSKEIFIALRQAASDASPSTIAAKTFIDRLEKFKGEYLPRVVNRSSSALLFAFLPPLLLGARLFLISSEAKSCSTLDCVFTDCLLLVAPLLLVRRDPPALVCRSKLSLRRSTLVTSAEEDEGLVEDAVAPEYDSNPVHPSSSPLSAFWYDWGKLLELLSFCQPPPPPLPLDHESPLRLAPPPVDPPPLECELALLAELLPLLAPECPAPFTRAAALAASHGWPWASVLILSRYRAAARSSCESKKSRAFRLPPTFIFSSSTSFHLSIETERTKERCTPRPRCLPEHSRHIQMPYVTDTHWGLSLSATFPSSCTSSSSSSVSFAEVVLLCIGCCCLSRSTARRLPPPTFITTDGRSGLDSSVERWLDGAWLYSDVFSSSVTVTFEGIFRCTLGRWSMADAPCAVGPAESVRLAFVLPQPTLQMLMVQVMMRVERVTVGGSVFCQPKLNVSGGRRLLAVEASPLAGSPLASGPLYRYTPTPPPPTLRLLAAPGCFSSIVDLSGAPPSTPPVLRADPGDCCCSFGWQRYTMTLLSLSRLPYAAALCCSFSEMMFTFRSSVSILSSSLHIRSSRSSLLFIASMIGSGLEPSRSLSYSSSRSPSASSSCSLPCFCCCMLCCRRIDPPPPPPPPPPYR